jgi:hypothetical protein
VTRLFGAKSCIILAKKLNEPMACDASQCSQAACWAGSPASSAVISMRAMAAMFPQHCSRAIVVMLFLHSFVSGCEYYSLGSIEGCWQH